MNDFMTNYKLSIFNNAFQTIGNETTLSKEFEDIKNGTYKNEILNCRNSLIIKKDKELFKKYKSQLKAVTFCGQFENGRKLSNLIHYNKLIVIDIDNINSEEINIVKTKLINDEYIMALWDSPSSLGLKGLVKVESTIDNHKDFFSSLSIYFLQQYNIELDKSGSDITRLCYVSFDENIYINNDSKMFSELINFEVDIDKTTDVKKDIKVKEKQNISLSKSAFATEGMNNTNDRKQIKKIIKFLSSKNLSITDSYYNWIKIAVIIANSFSYDIGEDYFLSICRIDSVKHDELKSKELLKYCYNNRKLNHSNRMTFASLIFLASEKGFVKR
jgi:hypothetical protein